jgi:hypothetical protein
MPAERPHGTEIAGVAALGLALCCGLPVLLSVGAGAAISGIGVRSWLLGLAGLVAVGAGLWRLRRRTQRAVPSDQTPER